MTALALISTRHEYWSLWSVYVPIAGGVFALFLFLLLFAVVRYRRRDEAARWHEHNPLEGGYAVLLALTVAVLLYLTFSHEHRVDTVANRQRPTLTINVTAARWEWQFAYPRYGIVQRSGTMSNQPLVVPVGQAIRFNLTSVDVIHALWIPELEYKHDAIPGSVQTQVLTFTRPGTFPGQCAVFCGLRHPEMVFRARAVPPRAFAAWVRSKRGSGGT